MALPLVFPRQMLPLLRACALRQDWFLSQEHEQRVMLLTNAAYSTDDVTKRVPLVIQITEAWDVRDFPSTAWDQLAALPTGAAIYYVVNRDSIILYVGVSKHLRQRWVSHHRMADLAAAGAARIAWQAVWPEFLLLEGLFISYCQPQWQRVKALEGR
jgi:predicted component of type VI protein secretion system